MCTETSQCLLEARGDQLVAFPGAGVDDVSGELALRGRDSRLSVSIWLTNFSA